jgi:hypothetical protein
MRIYSHKVYRKIYEEHFGPIPVDKDGRTYEIHHIDGDHNNNDPNNLKAVTIKEHYDIHYTQGDYVACALMAFRMNLTQSELSDIRSKAAYERVKNGTHPWKNKDRMREQNRKRTKEGKNAFSNPDIVKQQINNGTHATTKRITCLGCKKETYVAMFNKWHQKCLP